MLLLLLPRPYCAHKALLGHAADVKSKMYEVTRNSEPGRNLHFRGKRESIMCFYEGREGACVRARTHRPHLLLAASEPSPQERGGGPGVEALVARADQRQPPGADQAGGGCAREHLQHYSCFSDRSGNHIITNSVAVSVCLSLRRSRFGRSVSFVCLHQCIC